MKYFVFCHDQYGTSQLFEFESKQEALLCVATNTGEDSYCRLVEGKELVFKIKQIAEEI